MSANPHESSNQKLSDLLRWLQEGGASFPKVELVCREDGERAVIAREAIAQGEKVIQVPRRFMITVELARESEIGRAIAESLNPDNEDLYLASFLLQEKYREGSFWKPYIDSLPESYPQMPLFYDEADCERLKGSMLPMLLRFQADALQKDYQQLCERVPGYDRFTPEEFVWARLSVSSRQFYPKQGGYIGRTLVPLSDMLNHRRPPDVRWESPEDGESFVMTAQNDVAAGDEIFDSYGPLSNDLLLLHFGFLTQENEHDGVVVSLCIIQEEPLFPRKQELLRLGSSFWRPFKISRHYLDTATRDAFSFLRIAGASTPGDFETLAARYRAGERPLVPLNADDEENVLEILGAVCRARLTNYPTSREEDEQMLLEESFELNAYHSVLLRHEEKQLIEDYIEMTRVCIELLHTPREEVEKLAALPESPWGWFDTYVRAELMKVIPA